MIYHESVCQKENDRVRNFEIAEMKMAEKQFPVVRWSSKNAEEVKEKIGEVKKTKGFWLSMGTSSEIAQNLSR